MASGVAAKAGAESKRLVLIVGLAVIATGPPLILGRIFLGADAMTVLVFGTLVGFINTVSGGRRVGAGGAIAFILLTPVAVVVGQVPIAGAFLMAMGCILVGTSAYWQRFGGFTIILVGMLFEMSLPKDIASQLVGGVDQSSDLVWVLVGTAACAFWPVLVVPFLNAVRDIPIDAHNSKPDTLRHAVTLTVLVSATTFYALAFARDSHGVWLPLTLLMVLQVSAQSTWHRAIQRVWGTITGAVFAALAVAVIPEQWVIGVLMVLALVGFFATMGREPYGVFAFFLTSVILLGVSFSEPAVQVGFERVLYTILGSALALAAIWVGRILPERQRSDPQSAATPT